VDRILRGESDIVAEARRLKVKPAAVKGWVTMARNGTSMGRKKSAEAPGDSSRTDAPRSDADGPSTSARLERALRSSSGDGPAPDEDADAEPLEGSIPPPDPEALVAFTETVRRQALKMYAGVVGANPDDERVARVFEFTEDERRTLLLWAPYAAKYVPVLVGKSDEVGAWIYVGVNIASLWTGMAALRRLAPRKETRSSGDRFAGPGDPVAPMPTSPDPSG